MAYGIRQLMPYAPYAGGLATYPVYRGRTSNAMPFNRSQTRTITKTRKRQRGSNSVSKQIMRTMPSKQNTQDTSATLTHNTLVTLNLTQLIVQGQDNASRIGDSVNLSALKLKGSYFSAATAGAYQFRMLVGYSGEEISAATFTSGLGTSQLFLPNTATTFSTNGIVNPKAFTVLYDTTIDLNSQIANVVDIAAIVGTVSLNDAKFQYQSSASVYGKIKNLYIVCMAIVGAGSSGVTAAGTFVLGTDLIFK